MSKIAPKLVTLICLFSLMLVFVATPSLTYAQDNTDSDGDGLVDTSDNCPNEFGLPANGGCPDTEGVPPAVDTDQDGVVDSADNCPTDFGPVTNVGCPSAVNAGDLGQGGGAAAPATAPIVNSGAVGTFVDSDSDGVADAFDNCPNVFAQYGGVGGCPNIYTGGFGGSMADSDRDGLIDTSDSCPNEFALTASGCPFPGSDSGGGSIPPGQGGGQVPAPYTGPSECPYSMPARLTVGGTGQIAAVYSTLRNAPNGAPIRRMNGPATFSVLEGPVCNGGLTYFRIDYGNNTVGWALESERSSIFGVNRYWLAP